MIETSRAFQIFELILDHPLNAGRDPHEVAALAKTLKRMTLPELESELAALQGSEE